MRAEDSAPYQRLRGQKQPLEGLFSLEWQFVRRSLHSIKP
jgi:hypothetical protein